MIFFGRDKLSKLVDPKKTDEELKKNPLMLEKGDLPAMIIAAFLVYGPVVLVLFAILFLLSL